MAAKGHCEDDAHLRVFNEGFGPLDIRPFKGVVLMEKQTLYYKTNRLFSRSCELLRCKEVPWMSFGPVYLSADQQPGRFAIHYTCHFKALPWN